MIKFLFEDRCDTPSSILLKSSYNGKNILFAGGDNASNMFKHIKEYKDSNKDDLLIVFFDLPPNSEDTYNNYEKLLEALLDNNYTNVYVVPIICIEYYILKFIVENKYLIVDDKNIELVNNLVLSFDYNNKEVIDFVEKSNYRKESLEHVYKELLTFLVAKSKCMLNHTPHDKDGNVISDSYYGIFYKKDCTCDRRFCRSDCNVRLKEKAERLYVELPIFDVVNDDHRNFLSSLDIEVRDKNFKRLFDEVFMLFDEICKSMHIPKPLMMRYD